MAVAGSMTTAYWVRLVGGKVSVDKTTKLSTLCDSPADAITIMRRGEIATVRGSDMSEFWRLWNAQEVR